MKALPDNELPIAEWEYQERAYENICVGLARVLPESYVARPKEFAAAKQILLHRQSTQTTAITTALRDAGGFGKTTLALALCHDSEIQAAFPDGILWVELGEQHRKPLGVLNNILASLEPSRTEAVTLEEAKKHWQAFLQDRVCLLVIDDVWQAETLLPLLEGGPSCRRLVTTRNDLLLPRDIERVLVDAMEPHEAVAVLYQGLPEAIHHTASRSNLEALAACLGYWPLLLTLANGLLTNLMDAHLNIAEALSTIAEAYQARGVMAFRLDNVEERQQTVDACLGVSLQHLETFTHLHYHATERYRELAVFPEDTDIPLATLQVYWKGSAGLEPWETKDLCTRLHRLSLLLTCDLGTGTIRLHDVLRSYLIQKTQEQLPALHERLLNAYQQTFSLTRWADVPRREAYLWQHLVFHLCQANKQETIQTTLTDLSYLTRKAFYGGTTTLEADLLLASKWLSSHVTFPFLADLSRSIVRINYLLRQTSTETEMGGILLSYLPEELITTDQRVALERELLRPFFVFWHPLPKRISSTLRRTLSDHTAAIWGCAVSENGSLIVSATGDGTLKVWETASGAERLTLFGHSSGVNGCAISGDGSLIVSASDDHTLKVWDATSGVERFTLHGHTKPVLDCAVSRDGSVIVSCSWGDHKVWDATTGTEQLTLSGHIWPVYGCAISGDGKVMVTASDDYTLKVWDATTGTEQLTLSGHNREVRGCAISRDGNLVVSASWDRTLKVWDTTSRIEQITVRA